LIVESFGTFEPFGSFSEKRYLNKPV